MKSPAGKPPRKLRNDSAQAFVEAMKPARTIQPPSHMKLRPQDLPFWRSVLSGRARDEWGPADLVLAVQLARVQADIEREDEALQAEGAIIPTQAGGRKANPRGFIVDQLVKREQSLMRTLRMGGKVAGRQSALLSGRALERAADSVRAALGEGGDGLLAH